MFSRLVVAAVTAAMLLTVQTSSGASTRPPSGASVQIPGGPLAQAPSAASTQPSSAAAVQTSIAPSTQTFGGPSRTSGEALAQAPSKVPAPSRQLLPLPYHGNAQQVVTVVADSTTATTAILTAWQRTGPSSDDWTIAHGPVRAFIGADGVGQASETTSKTPAGVWTLTEAFGIQANDGTRLPYRQVGSSDWWVSDANSPLYNTYYHCDPGTCPFDEAAGEDLGKTGPVYDHAVVIDYNRTPVAHGGGSAFFLHITNGRPTAGCVAIPSDDLKAVMAWLDPAKHPVIDIGVR